LSDEFIENFHNEPLVQNHGLTEEELMLYQHPDPITVILEVKHHGLTILLRATSELDLKFITLLVKKVPMLTQRTISGKVLRIIL
jgi:hypothetical protein